MHHSYNWNTVLPCIFCLGRKLMGIHWVHSTKTAQQRFMPIMAQALKCAYIFETSLIIPYPVYRIIHLQSSSPAYTAVPKVFPHRISLIYQIYQTSSHALIQWLKLMQQFTQKVLLFLEWIAILRNQLLPTRLDLLLQYLILIFLRVFPSILIRNLDSRRDWSW